MLDCGSARLKLRAVRRGIQLKISLVLLHVTGRWGDDSPSGRKRSWPSFTRSVVGRRFCRQSFPQLPPPTMTTTEAPDPRSFKTADDAFQYPVPVVRKLEQQLRHNADENREKLRSLVG